MESSTGRNDSLLHPFRRPDRHDTNFGLLCSVYVRFSLYDWLGKGTLTVPPIDSLLLECSPHRRDPSFTRSTIHAYFSRSRIAIHCCVCGCDPGRTLRWKRIGLVHAISNEASRREQRSGDEVTFRFSWLSTLGKPPTLLLTRSHWLELMNCWQTAGRGYNRVWNDASSFRSRTLEHPSSNRRGNSSFRNSTLDDRHVLLRDRINAFSCTTSSSIYRHRSSSLRIHRSLLYVSTFSPEIHEMHELTSTPLVNLELDLNLIFEEMGDAKASGLLGALTTGIGFITTTLCLVYGKRWREKYSRYDWGRVRG